VASAARKPVPDSSAVSAVLPFQLIDSLIFVPAAVNDRRGLFMLDVGAMPLVLNQRYWRYTRGVEVDTLLDPRDAIPHDTTDPFPSATVRTVQLGPFVHQVTPRDWDTLSVNFEKIRGALARLQSDLTPAGSQPVLGNLGLMDLTPYETVFDYTHQRLVLIRVDTAGRRLAPVPEFTPVAMVPLVSEGQHLGITMRAGEAVDTFWLDTGAPTGILAPPTRARLGEHVRLIQESNLMAGVIYDKVTVDTIRLGERAVPGGLFDALPLGVEGGYPNLLGYSFLHQLGTFGINCRTRQLIFYR
jgi:hypothetical protein